MTSTRCAAALAAVVLLLVLEACGGATGLVIRELIENGEHHDEDSSTHHIPQTPVLSSAEIKAELHAIYDRSDTFIVEHGGTPHWTGPREVFETSNLDDVVAFHLDGRTWGAPPDYDFLGNHGEFEFVGSEGGISVAAATWDATNPAFRSAVVSLSLGAWMEHSFFLAKEDIALDPLHDDISVYLDIFSIGAASGTNPSPLEGSATWAGVMFGIDERAYAAVAASQFENAEPNIYEGEAAITLTSFADPAVDVRFSNITNTVHYLSDVAWRNLPVTEGGFEGRGILGRFYGAQHEEVGGVFQFGTINGAFGALRE